MKKSRWEILRESISGDTKTTVYTHKPISSGITIVSEKKRIAISSGCRYETVGIYIRKDGVLLKHKYTSFAEAKTVAERMM